MTTEEWDYRIINLCAYSICLYVQINKIIKIQITIIVQDYTSVSVVIPYYVHFTITMFNNKSKILHFAPLI